MRTPLYSNDLAVAHSGGNAVARSLRALERKADPRAIEGRPEASPARDRSSVEEERLDALMIEEPLHVAHGRDRAPERGVQRGSAVARHGRVERLDQGRGLQEAGHASAPGGVSLDHVERARLLQEGAEVRRLPPVLPTGDLDPGGSAGPQEPQPGEIR